MPHGRPPITVGDALLLQLIRGTRTLGLEYDAAKDAANRRKHGLPLRLGADVVVDARESGTVLEDTRHAYPERRFIAYGKAQGRLMVCVFTPRGERIRVISLRKANARERAAYG